MNDLRQSYRTRWLFPVDGEPIENGTIEIERGRITAIHARLDPRAEDLGNVALIPGLVNTHTHLEFSDLSQPLGPAEPFTSWIRSLVAHRRGRSETPTAAISLGLQESSRCGVTTVGEIATSDESWGEAGDLPRIVVFRELLGLPKEQIDEQLAIAREHVSEQNSARVVRGLSPHAPYSVHPELFQRLIDLATQHDVPVAVHLAETRAECELLADGTGEFAEMLKAFGVWKNDAIPRGTVPLDYLRMMQDARHSLVIHGNYLSRDELDFVVEHGQLTVIYCPRTHAYFGHEPHPWQALLSRRENSVALGTDSRASNPDLGLWGEVLFLKAAFPETDPALLLQLATLNGARALDLDDEVGSLSTGKQADMAMIALPSTDSTDAFGSLLESGNRIVGTMRAGCWTVRA